jgi:GntR family transcriptional regulator
MTKIKDMPIFERIEQSVREGIASGVYASGVQLPSETALAARFNTTRATVRQALSRLVFEGMVTRHVGRGSFVAPPMVGTFPIDSRHCLPFEDQVALEGLSVNYRSPNYELVQAPTSVLRQLSLSKDTQVFKLERLRMINNSPVCLEIRYLPIELGQAVTGEMLLTYSVHAFVSEIVGYRVPTIVVKVSAIVADAMLASRLEVPKGSALIVRDNIFLDPKGQVMICGKSVFRGDIETEYVLGPDLRKPVKR